MADSILDRVLSVKHAEEAARFVPRDLLNLLLTPLTSREREVVMRRFGLSGKPQETLEGIGKSYEITRERVRQIERLAIQKIRSAPTYAEQASVIEHVIARVLTDAGGVLDTDALIDQLTSTRDRRDESRAIVHFLLHEVIADRFQRIDADTHIRDGWALRSFNVEQTHDALSRLEKFLGARGVPAEISRVISEFRSSEWNMDTHSDDMIESSLRIASTIRSNPFGEYGLKTWPTVVPRRMTDKIYLVLSHHKKPLHFTEIAQRINEAKFDQKIAHAPTVHNELIIDQRFVLVGRGMYGLRELGFKPGIVADVIEDVLRSASEPLRRDDIVDRVLKQRVVGRATVYLALMNKKRFVRLPDGRYQVFSPQTPSIVS